MTKFLQFLLTICCAPLLFAEDVMPDQGTEFFTFPELLSLSENPRPTGPLKEKMDRFFRTPIVSNAAWREGHRREPKTHPQLGDHIRVASWNIEKSFHVDRAANYIGSAEAYAADLEARRLDLSGSRHNMLRQQRRINGADILILQEMDIGVSRSDYVDAAKLMAENLNMNYAYAPAQLEVDPVLLGLEKSLNRAGEIMESYEVDRARYKGVFGSAVLSRYPIKKVICFPLITQPYDWYTEEVKIPSTVESGKRFAAHELFHNDVKRELKAGGGRPFFRVDLHVPGIPHDTLTVINVHLEIKCPPSEREAQMKEILSYIKDIRHHVVMMGDHNSSAVDISPTNLKNIGQSLATDKSNWVSGLTTLLTPQSTTINTARRAGNVVKNFHDPLAPNIPVLLPNKVKPMFDRIGKFRFDDGAVFDFRGDAERSISGVGRSLANSNERSSYKGFQPSFSVKRPIGILGLDRLDWVFVKRSQRYEGSADGPYRLAPHFGETLHEFNSNLSAGPVSDHSPNIVDLPFGEPDFSKIKRETFLPIRYEENWDHLIDPPDTLRLSLSDRMKWIPFGKERANNTDQSSTYSLGFNTRLRTLGRDLGEPEELTLEYQARFFGDVQLASGWRGFAEVLLGGGLNDDPARLAPSEEVFDILNAFIETRQDLARVRLGRQMFELGEGRLLSINPWAPTLRSWDGAAVETRGAFGDARLFGGQLVDVENDVFNVSSGDDRIAGLDLRSRHGLGAYLLANRQDELDRETFTGGLSGNRTWGDLDLQGELALQRGDVDGEDQKAAMLSVEIGYLMKQLPLYPRFWLGFDFASGDDDPVDPDRETFDALYGNTHDYLGISDVVGRRNLTAFSQGIQLAPNGETSFGISHHLFMRAEQEDAVYRANGEAYAEAELGSGDVIGNEIDLTYHFRINPNWRTTFGYGILFADDAFADESTRQTLFGQMEWIY